jgi:hypothetical protein
MQIIEFIFKSPFTFIGTVILIAVTMEGIEGIVRHFRK